MLVATSCWWFLYVLCGYSSDVDHVNIHPAAGTFGLCVSLHSCFAVLTVHCNNLIFLYTLTVTHFICSYKHKIRNMFLQEVLSGNQTLMSRFTFHTFSQKLFVVGEFILWTWSVVSNSVDFGSVILCRRRLKIVLSIDLRFHSQLASSFVFVADITLLCK